MTPTERFALKRNVSRTRQGIEHRCPERLSMSTNKRNAMLIDWRITPSLDPRFISETKSAFRFGLLASGQCFLGLYKQFSCKAYQGNFDVTSCYFMSFNTGRHIESKTRTAHGRLETRRGGPDRLRFFRPEDDGHALYSKNLRQLA